MCVCVCTLTNSFNVMKKNIVPHNVFVFLSWLKQQTPIISVNTSSQSLFLIGDTKGVAYCNGLQPHNHGARLQGEQVSQSW